jgi:aminoglycoside phosphotransferase (APT) family kinase protein
MTALTVAHAQRLVDRSTHPSATVVGCRRLSGGASRATWVLDLSNDAGAFHLIAQISPIASSVGVTRSVATEVAVVQAAHGAGVPTPVVYGFDEHDAELGAAWVLSSFVSGESIARRIQRDDTYQVARTRFVADAASALARLHGVTDPEVLDRLANTDQVSVYRDALDQLGHPSPAFELGFRWLEAHRPASVTPTLVHGDFRLGNVLMAPDGLASVLDWELAHAGDPMEDLGWICVRAWRFGGAPVVAGLGDLDSFVAAYNVECVRLGREPLASADAVRWWIVLGTVKWGVMCVMQASRHLLGLGGRHEHAAIGRRIAQNEWDVLQLIGLGPTI